MTRDEASLIVRMDVALGREGIGPRSPFSVIRDLGSHIHEHHKRFVRDRLEGVFQGDEEPADAALIDEAYRTLGLNPDWDYE